MSETRSDVNTRSESASSTMASSCTARARGLCPAFNPLTPSVQRPTVSQLDSRDAWEAESPLEAEQGVDSSYNVLQENNHLN